MSQGSQPPIIGRLLEGWTEQPEHDKAPATATHSSVPAYRPACLRGAPSVGPLDAQERLAAKHAGVDPDVTAEAELIREAEGLLAALGAWERLSRRERITLRVRAEGHQARRESFELGRARRVALEGAPRAKSPQPMRSIPVVVGTARGRSGSSGRPRARRVPRTATRSGDSGDPDLAGEDEPPDDVDPPGKPAPFRLAGRRPFEGILPGLSPHERCLALAWRSPLVPELEADWTAIAEQARAEADEALSEDTS
jgi:hypothetical protein